ncbi:MAG: hypothetical protein ACOX8U_07630 [Bradymonadia bacterium]|jgi:hypothetical protein
MRVFRGVFRHKLILCLCIMALFAWACESDVSIEPIVYKQSDAPYLDLPDDPNPNPDPDLNPDPDPDPDPDIEERLAACEGKTQDSDGDGLPDCIEEIIGTKVLHADSDLDGLCDGSNDVEGVCVGGEDLNNNGIIDSGETDPRNADTDEDGLLDGLEKLHSCTDPLNPDTDGDTILDGIEDFNANGIYEAEYETNPCDVDSDKDTIPDGCEDRNQNGFIDPGESDPRKADSDGDTIPDGEECSGYYTDCPDYDNADHCPTNPAMLDTDNDTIPDNIELSSNYKNGATDPRNPDTDGDTILDGLEDLNRNGRFDEGELDPTTDMTYEGKYDKDNPIAVACVKDEIKDSTRIEDDDGDIVYLIEKAYAHQSITLGSLSKNNKAYVIEATDKPLLAFIISKPSESSDNANAEQEMASISHKIGINAELPRSFNTWDGFTAVYASFNLTGYDNVSAARNDIIAKIFGLPLSDLGNLPEEKAAESTASDYDMILSIVYRTNKRTLLMGVVTPVANTEIEEHEISDLYNTSALAQVKDEIDDTCDLITITEIPKVDFLFVIDDSASMNDEQDAVNETADYFFAKVHDSFLDARWAVTSVEYEGASGVSKDNVCGLTRGRISGSVWNSFELEMTESFKQKVNDPASIEAPGPKNSLVYFGENEYGLRCAKLAIDYIQGKNTAAGKALSYDRQRLGSALITVILTDEDDNEVDLGTGAVGKKPLQTLISEYQEYFDAMKDSSGEYGSVTPFAIITLEPKTPEEKMPLFEALFKLGSPYKAVNAVPADIGNAESIQTAINAVIDRAGGIASNYRPKYNPITLSFKLKIRRLNEGLVDMPRSKISGWSYDSATNSLSFAGQWRPQRLDDVALTYQYFIKKCFNPDGCQGVN